MTDAMQTQLRQQAARLLREGFVTRVLGFRAGEPVGSALPFFARSEADAETLVLSRRCVPHLAVYLPELAGKTAVVAKPCDVRSIVVQLAECRLKREDLTIISFSCPGMTDENGSPLPACTACEASTPPLSDILLEDEGIPKTQEPPQQEGEPAPKTQKNTPPDETFDFARFQAELQKCILCYSCRQACPGCSCAVCFADRTSPAWLSATPGLSDKMIFHLGRTMHLAGRCTGCGACEQACASGVDLAFLRRAVAAFVKEEYGFTAGLNPAEPPALQNHAANDTEAGFHGGTHHG